MSRSSIVLALAIALPSVAFAAGGGGGGSGGGGAAASTGSPSTDSALRGNGTTMPGPDRPTVTKEQDSDAKIDEENRKLDRTVSGICKGC
ncbi:MAG TPA: hypothetical protein VHB49_19490 [Bradyrhizobium sp.]|nr:hypothetical protein [Bradyrhizobium sp.]